MSYIFQGSDFSEFLASTNVQENKESSSGVVDPECMYLRTPKGEISYKECAIKDNLTVLQGRYEFNEDISIFGKGDSHLLEMHFNLSETDIFFQNKAIKNLTTPAMSGNITYLSPDEHKAKISFGKGMVYETFDVHLPISLLTAYAGESKVMDLFLSKINLNTSAKLSRGDIKVNPKIYSTIYAIRNCAFEGLTKKIYLESKVLELLAFVHECSGLDERTVRLTDSDEERIRYAATLIQENLKKPYTIVELARAVGINQTKLKSGFKTLFGTTVFNYLQETRMQMARELLLNTSFPIQHIANLSGYSSISNFSVAFKQAQGYSPKMLRSKV